MAKPELDHAFDVARKLKLGETKQIRPGVYVTRDSTPPKAKEQKNG